MPLDLLAKFRVVQKAAPEEATELFAPFLADNETPLLSYKHPRDRIVFTDRKIIAMDSQGITGKKKSFRVFPYPKISSFSVETASTLTWTMVLRSGFRGWDIWSQTGEKDRSAGDRQLPERKGEIAFRLFHF